MRSSTKTVLLTLSIIFAAGVTPIAIRYTQAEGMPSLVIVFIRLWLITIGLLPIIWTSYKSDLLKLSKKQITLSAIAGFWSALNLLMLFLALEYTSVLITSVLRRTTPLWIIAPEIFLLGAVFSRRIWWSLGFTLIGVLMIAFGGAGAIEIGTDPVLGSGLATFGAICFGVYLLMGRKISQDMPSLLYSWLVFLSASIIITIFIILTGTSLIGYTAEAYIWSLVVTFVAQVMGQLAIVISLQRFSATAMAIIVQVGVVVSAIIAAFLFNEIPSFWQSIGSLLVIIGVILATIEQSKPKAKPLSDA